jgi:hypothetical protein
MLLLRINKVLVFLIHLFRWTNIDFIFLAGTFATVLCILFVFSTSLLFSYFVQYCLLFLLVLEFLLSSLYTTLPSLVSVGFPILAIFFSNYEFLVIFYLCLSAGPILVLLLFFYSKFPTLHFSKYT